MQIVTRNILCALLLILGHGPARGVTQAEADQLLANADYAAAIAAYTTLLEADPTQAGNWFSLATAQHNQGAYPAAREAYQKALENGFQPPARVHYHLARAAMSLGDQDAALTDLEALAQAGGPAGSVLTGTAEFAPLLDAPRFQAVVTALTPCATPEYRQFDFWLGEWDVTPAGAAAPSATNSLTSVHGGCVVLEQYVAGGFTGMSLSFYDSARKKWHQTWNSNSGGALYLDGGLVDGAMVLSDRGLETSALSGTINRVTWTPLDDGRVRQHWQSTTDDGETWTTVFDGYYSRREE